jgi:hypothetical protein
MATTTPNYGWAVPTSTDLVKDGATAIETLGDAIDASMNTALGTKKAGMVLLNTTSFSGVTSISLAADTFTTTYNVYQMLVNISSGSGDYSIRLRAAGTDNTASNYRYATWFQATSGTSGNNGSSTGTTSFSQAFTAATDSNQVFWIYNPKLAVPTGANFMNVNGSAGSVALGALQHTTSTAFDSLTIFNATNISGTIRVYGLNQ